MRTHFSNYPSRARVTIFLSFLNFLLYFNGLQIGCLSFFEWI